MGKHLMSGIKGRAFKELTMLQQSVYVLEKLDEGLTMEQIIVKCDGDEQLVSIWIEFLKDLNWLVKNSPSTVPNAGVPHASEAGKKAIEKYGKIELA